jgi:hypothetical protein
VEGADCKKTSVAAHDVQWSYSALDPDGKLVLLIEGLFLHSALSHLQNHPKLTKTPGKTTQN